MKKTAIFGRNIEQSALDQFNSAMQLDCIVQGALMPDAHTGYTLPIGAVVASEGYIFPAFVGYDIGCGMCALKTPFKTAHFTDEVKQNVFKSVYRSVPCGEGKFRNTPVEWDWKNIPHTDVVNSVMQKGIAQIGTLGGGNHFIEIAHDENDFVWIVIHSGSRGVGHKVATHYMEIAKNIANSDTSALEREFDSNDKYATLKEMDLEKYEEVKGQFIESKLNKQNGKRSAEGLYGLDVESEIGNNYIKDMEFCLEFALQNRRVMLLDVLNDIQYAMKFEYDSISSKLPDDIINRNHNHAELRDDIWIHRKGATHAEKGMMGVIPGNMRDGSFIVIGKGNPDSLYSSSHGGGRVMSRKNVEKTFTLEQFSDSMTGIVAKVDKETLDECPMAYKDIFEVMDLQKDLVTVIHHLKPIINIKG